MTNPTASLQIGALTFSGNDDGSALGLVAMNEPALQPRITYADDSAHVAGSLATQAVWQQSMLNATVSIQGTSAADLETQVQQVRDELAKFTNTAITNTNGTVKSWRCDMGAMVQTDGEYLVENLSDFEEFYNVSLPVYPIPGA